MHKSYLTGSVILLAGYAVVAIALESPDPSDSQSDKIAPGNNISSPSKATSAMLDYPIARRGDVVDDYHGTKVPDPYRWLEDPDSPESRRWIETENRLTESYLAKIPEHKAIHHRLQQLWNYERYGLPHREGDTYFYSHNNGLQNQSVLLVADDHAFASDDKPRVLLDPNKLSDDGTVALAGSRPSDDGKYLAYGLASGGSDWNEWRVRDVVSGRDLDDHLKWVKFSNASWTKDGRGFFYSRYDEPPRRRAHQANYFQKLFSHRLGTPQSDDTLVYERRITRIGASPATSPTTAVTSSSPSGRARAARIRSFIRSWPASRRTESRRAAQRLRCQLQLHRQRRHAVLFLTDNDAPRRK